jgi:AcrR family transcriptional regulator
MIKLPAERRQEIIEVSRELFESKGVRHTKVSDIVKKIGVAQGLFYYYFKSKSDVVKVIQEQILTEIQDTIKTISHDGNLNLYKKATKYIDLYIALRKKLFNSSEKVHSISISKMAEERILSDLKNLLYSAAAKGELKLQYPDETIEIIFLGIKEISKTKTLTKHMMQTLLEQSLNLPYGSFS